MCYYYFVAFSANVDDGSEVNDPTASNNIAHHIKFLKESRAKCGFDSQDLNSKFNHLHDSKTQESGDHCLPVFNNNSLLGIKSIFNHNSSRLPFWTWIVFS